MVDALGVSVRRDTMAKVAVMVVLEMMETGQWERLDFEVAPAERAANGEALWQRIRAQEVLLAVMDGLPGLEDVVRRVFLKGDRLGIRSVGRIGPKGMRT